MELERATSVISRDRQADFVGVGALILVHIAWGSLLLMHRDWFCFQDCTIEMLPRQIALARSFQSGVIPFWDVNTFAGARLFWVSGGALYYPILYPLYLLTNTRDLNQAAVLLQLLPFVLHVAWASLGGYFFARRVMHLTVGGAMVAGLAFSFSPTMLTRDDVNLAQGYSYLPWITLVAVRVLDTGSRRTWAAGALLVGAMCSAGSPDVVNRTLFLVGVQVASYWLLSRWRTTWTGWEIARLLALLPMVLLGMGMFSFSWVGLYKGISLLMAAVSLTCQQVARFTDDSSLPLASMLTMFYPRLFVQTEPVATLGAGSLLLSAASCAFIRPSHLPETLRPSARWLAIAAGIVGGGILVALGYHTPAFEWMCRALPLFFGFPHPVNYTVAVGWGLAMLAGAGVSVLTTSSPSRTALVLCSWPAVAAALVIAAHPPIGSFEWEHRFIDASEYVMVAALLLLTVVGLPQRLRARVMWAGVSAEILVSPFYLAATLPFSFEPLRQMDYRTWRLSHDPSSELLPTLRRIADEDTVRFVGTRSLVDNQAWVVNGRALFGKKAEPILPSFQHATASFVANAPYEYWLVKLPRFLANMNVGYLVADRGYPSSLTTPVVWDAVVHVGDLEEPYWKLNADLKSAIASLPLVESTEHFDIHAIPSPLPYVYTQDQVSELGVDQQRIWLLDMDLRERALVGPEADAYRRENLARSRPIAASDPTAELTPGAPPAVHFEALQKINPVLKIDRSNPNRKVIQVEVRKPALLVVAETWHPGWHARVDGKDAPVWPVNYLQQGVWLEAGTHRVELSFCPDYLLYGVVASAASLITIALVGIRGGRRRRALPEAHGPGRRQKLI